MKRVLSLFLTMVLAVGIFSVVPAQAATKTVSVSYEIQEDYKEAWDVLELVNKERADNGLSKLKMDESLLKTAMKRAGETAVCFSHTRPNGSSCFAVFRVSRLKGENIAAGQKNAMVVEDSWMHSSGHRANILHKDFKSIGVGCVCVNGTYYWTQCFDDAKAKVPKKSSSVKNKTFKTKILKKNINFKQSGGQLVVATGEKEHVDVCLFNEYWEVPLHKSCLDYSFKDKTIAKVKNGYLYKLKDGATTLSVSIKGYSKKKVMFNVF